MKFAEQRISNPPRNKKTPVGVLLAHSLGNASRESLFRATKNTEWCSFGAEGGICSQQVDSADEQA